MTGPHAALMSILADLAADALGFGLVVASVWALVKGNRALQEWRRDRQAADRATPALRLFETRRQQRYPRMTEATRQAIIHEATHE